MDKIRRIINNTALISLFISLVIGFWTAGIALAGETDNSIVAADKEAIIIEYSADDAADRVTEDVFLNIFGDYGSDISWISDKPTVISDYGTVVRPLNNDVKVTLTATIEYGEATDTKRFIVTVLRLPEEEQWEDREVSVIQNNEKSWTIRFNKAVDFTSAQENIYVATDYRGLGIISTIVAATSDPCIITVSPEESWSNGAAYLFITRELCADSPSHPTLARGIRMRFWVQS